MVELAIFKVSSGLGALAAFDLGSKKVENGGRDGKERDGKFFTPRKGGCVQKTINNCVIVLSE